MPKVQKPATKQRKLELSKWVKQNKKNKQTTQPKNANKKVSGPRSQIKQSSQAIKSSNPSTSTHTHNTVQTQTQMKTQTQTQTQSQIHNTKTNRKKKKKVHLFHS